MMVWEIIQFVGPIPGTIININGLKELLDAIKKLYSLACKYGATNTIPRTIYRGDDGAARIITESFQSEGKWHTKKTEWT